MSQPFPYTYYSCDCYDSKATAKRGPQPNLDDEDERTFDPRHPRSNYSLYPLEHLLYCEDCQQIRCPRCVIEETLNWFCPNCLFEVPSSQIKSEGNRCTRSCYNCPICSSNMITNSLEPSDAEVSGNGPFYLSCPYCQWSTLETGIEFEKANGITQQLAKIGNGGRPLRTTKEREKDREKRKELESKRKDLLSESEDSPTSDKDREEGPPSHDDLFAALTSFYKSQIAAQAPSNPFSPHDSIFNSPSSFSRIMSLYSSTSSKKQKREKPSPMREASSALEGLIIHNPTTDALTIDKLKKEGWNSTLSPTQKLAQPSPTARFASDVRPLATLLRTKRGKRCRNCRHILSKPESKITSTRYKIKLLALNHIPRLLLSVLPPQTPHPPSQASFNYNALKPGLPTHFLLTLTNPLFDPIRITLATPSTTPGKISSRVTILCPQFDVGANTDVWDDALSSSLSPVKKAVGSDGQIEAGKIWDRGRNWTSVVLEVVPGFEKVVMPSFGASMASMGASVSGGGPALGASMGTGMGGQSGTAAGKSEDTSPDEDDYILEIPIFVRLEFEADAVAGEEKHERGEKEREKREEAFWTVVGAGRITPLKV